MIFRTIVLPLATVACSALPGWSQTPAEFQRTPAPPVSLPAELLSESSATNPGQPAGTANSAVLRQIPAEEPPATSSGTSLRIAPAPTEAATAVPQPAVPQSATAAVESFAETGPAKAPAVDEPVALRPFKLRGITPGDSTAAELTAAWGEQRQQKQEGGAILWQYEMEPFPVVTATIREDIVQHILIQLPEPQPVGTLAAQMKIEAIRPGRIEDAHGEALGLVFPERGVAFALLPPQQEAPVAIGELEVAFIVIEPISAEPFVRRAENDLLGPCEANLRDLEQAVRLDSHNAYTRHTLALFLHSLGRHEDALRAATTATQLDGSTLGYQLLRAEILGEIGKWDEATQIAAAVLQSAEATKLEQAQATALAAEFAARDGKADYAETVKQRQQAIALADSLISSEVAAERRAAKRLLMTAHLGVARDVARGNFKSKETVVPQWVTRGASFAEDLIRNEYGDELLRLEVARQAMTALAPIGGAIDPTQAVERTQRNAEKLLAATEDPLRQAWVQWNLGLILHDAMCIQYERRKIDEAEKLGQLAVNLLEEGSRMRQPTDRETIRLGQLYFRQGAIQAVFRKDHAQAAVWFEKAVPLLDELGPDAPVDDLGAHGESFVSMGVSCWSTGQRDQALLLTQRGLQFMEQAVQEGSLPETALSVPYTNLAAMHRQLGEETKAADFSRLAEKHRETTQR